MCRGCQENLRRIGYTHICEKCGVERIELTVAQMRKSQKKLPVICKKCREYGRQVKLRIACKDCGKEFIITNNDYEYFTKLQNGQGQIPKRCKECRDGKRNANQGEKRESSINYTVGKNIAIATTSAFLNFPFWGRPR